MKIDRWFLIAFQTVFESQSSEFLPIIHLNDFRLNATNITRKGDFFFSGKNKKDNKSLHFRFLFLFLLKKRI